VLQLDPTGPKLHPGRVTLLQVTGTDPQNVRVEVNHRQQLRFVTRYGDVRARTLWFDLPTSGGVRLGIRNQIALGFYQFVATPGGQVGYVPSVYFDRDQNSLPALLSYTDAGRGLASLGLTMRELAGLPMTLCENLAREAGIDVSGDS
jgi:hypothetical protein